MDDLIRRKATGCADEFAKKMGISKSQLYEDLKEMKELGAPIDYCQVRKSYIYNTEAKLIFTFQTDFKEIKGGQNFFRSSSITGVIDFIFVNDFI
jgi:DNA-binding transcriptional regulator GbsR (MarR family)